MNASGPVDLATIAAIAALNPVSALAAVVLGNKADQPQKLVIAAFVAAILGIAVIWLAAELRIEAIAKPARASAGIFVLQFLFGLFWAWLGFRLRRNRQ